MPRYFFHVRDEDEFSQDTEGQELADLDAAKQEALNANRELLGERLLHGGAINGRQIEIADESGNILATLVTDDVLFRDGNYRSYDNDVTKSAPVTIPISAKSTPE